MSDLLNKIQALLGRGEAAAAEQLLVSSLKEGSGTMDALKILVALKTSTDKWQEAIDVLKNSLETLPDNAEIYFLLGGVYRAQGAMRLAEESYNKSIEIDPLFSESYEALSRIVSSERRAQLLSDIESQLAKIDEDDRRRGSFYFAAANLCDGMGEFDKAFEHYSRANRLFGSPFSTEQFRNGIDALKKVFSKSFFAKRKLRGVSSKRPVFIVGMPRSGTTLVERMLASHPKIAGVGELSDISTISELIAKIYRSADRYPFSANLLKEEQIQALGGKYVERLCRDVDQSEVIRVVDKNPLNFLHIGLIRVLLPNAKIIHMKRDPVDTCLSCWFQHFGAGLEFSYSLEYLAEFYIGYARLMRHWHKILPRFILDVEYEKVVDNPERELKRILEFCGLQWDSSCLDFNRNLQPVRTASVWQVRQPLYSTSTERWKNYSENIQPLIKRLKDYS